MDRKKPLHGRLGDVLYSVCVFWDVTGAAMHKLLGQVLGWV